MQHVFGPVPSRRLGQSLGVDPIPFKTCNWNCVYCQLGRTSPPTNQRRDYFPPEDIVAEALAVLQADPPPAIDWVTFVGSGEPTLHASLGRMIRALKAAARTPVAVIANGALLHLPEVREELAAADAVLPTLDAGEESLYRRINRPLSELDFRRYVEGLVTFRTEYAGNLWLEVMLIADMNDSPEALRDLAALARRIEPNEVHLNSPVRPPCEPWVKPASPEKLRLAADILGEVCRVVSPTPAELDLSRFDNAVDAINDVIQRHPVSEEDLLRALDRWNKDHVRQSLEDLERSGGAQRVVRNGKRYWTSSAARYVSAPESSGRAVAAPSRN